MKRDRQPERPRDPHNFVKAGVPVIGQRLVEIFAAHPGAPSQLAEIARPRYCAERCRDGGRVAAAVSMSVRSRPRRIGLTLSGPRCQLELTLIRAVNDPLYARNQPHTALSAVPLNTAHNIQEVESMERRPVDIEAVKRAVTRSTVDSARLERRVVPADFVRSAAAEKFLAERHTAH